ncbi:hypothetical protein MKW98_021053 [Papaver atlanticum]|uniref:Phytocyanin domain-containing protein n=1 Tax=Papaver atlanticum TaxID=357466 RepID=A0AAD4XU10_9MAGN|nr:hypothetical protein MKW98_021053 [Papaver atlanticum]
MMNQQVWVLETIMKLMMVLSVFVYASSATKYTVGGASGWALDSDVQTWSSSNSFSVGDTLEFVYKPVHSVLEVNKLAYEACDSANPISVNNGNYTSVTLDTAGTRYFICGAQGHCSSGLKVKIVVNSTDPSGSGNRGRRSPRRPPTSGRSPPAPRQSPPPPSNTPGTPPSGGHEFPPSEPNAHGPSSSPSAATKITHQFVAPSVICLVLIKLMIIHL